MSQVRDKKKGPGCPQFPRAFARLAPRRPKPELGARCLRRGIKAISWFLGQASQLVFPESSCNFFSSRLRPCPPTPTCLIPLCRRLSGALIPCLLPVEAVLLGQISRGRAHWGSPVIASRVGRNPRRSHRIRKKIREPSPRSRQMVRPASKLP